MPANAVSPWRPWLLLVFSLPCLFAAPGPAEPLAGPAGEQELSASRIPEFSDYPAEQPFAGRPAPPVLSTREARRFRTMIRQDAAAGPNFAGHYTVAMWGCGSTCVAFAVVDARTGAVYFHPTVRRAWQAPDQAEGVLQFRRESRLLIIAGHTEGPDGTESVGRFFYEWKDHRFTLLRRDDLRPPVTAPPPACEDLAASAAESGLDRLCAELQNSYQCAQAIERHQLQQPHFAARVQRDGASLRLQLHSGRWLTITDPPEASDDEVHATFHNFRDYFPEIGYYLLHRQFYEGEGYLLVHQDSGSRYELHALPVVSPDRQRLVAASDGFRGGYSPNVIQIWRLAGNRMELEWSFEPQDWGPAHPLWLDSRAIRVQKNSPPADDSMPPAACATLRRNGQWHLVE
jgi:hypothetical protein